MYISVHTLTHIHMRGGGMRENIYKDPYHNRGRDQMRKKGSPEFECLCQLPPVNVLGEVNQKVFNKCQMIALLNSNSPKLLNTIVNFMNKCMSKRNSS